MRIDGSTGEGGGQILRTALALGAVARHPVEVVNIRANRPRPGLAPQHLTAVEAIATVSGAATEGVSLGSQRVRLEPGRVRPGRYTFDVAAGRPSAGAVTLVLQALLPVLATAAESSQLVLRGGTHVAWSPPVNWVQGVLAPALGALDIGLELELRRWGWYPKGGGELWVRVEPTREIRAARWNRRGPLRGVVGISAVGGLPDDIAARQATAARERLADTLGDLPVDLRTVRAGGRDKGTLCYLEADYADPPGASGASWDRPPCGFSSLGEKGKPAEIVGREAAEALLEHHGSGAVVDIHLADQILPLLALATGRSRYTTPAITGHVETNAWVCRKILGAQIELEQGPPAEVRVDGVGSS